MFFRSQKIFFVDVEYKKGPVYYCEVDRLVAEITAYGGLGL